MSKKLLLISSSKVAGRGFLDCCENEIRGILDKCSRVLFIPYARPGGITFDAYARIVSEKFLSMRFHVDSIHNAENPVAAVKEAEAIFIGGGNTFLLLKQLYEFDLLKHIRSRVEEGIPYLGSSAGSNVACPTIMTTNDMPIVYPPSFNALNLVPFQINPHYLDPDPNSRHQGETRETRIKEYLFHNDCPVVGLREGALLEITGSSVALKGIAGMKLFENGKEPREFEAGASLDFLLTG